MRPRIIIADDHRLIAIGLAEALRQSSFDVIGIADSGLDAIAMIKSEQPDLAVMDINMPGATGAEAFFEARRWAPETRFAVLTGYPSATLFSKLIEAGVSGIFLKSDDPSIIVDAVTSMLRGQTVLSPSVIELLSTDEGKPELTNREMQVLQGIARGLSNAAMGEAYGISPKTVDTHRTSLMKKLSVHSSAALLMKAVKLGLIAP